MASIHVDLLETRKAAERTEKRLRLGTKHPDPVAEMVEALNYKPDCPYEANGQFV